MKRRLLPIAVLCGLALVASCSASADYEPTENANGGASAVPHWIREAARLARAERSAGATGSGAGSSSSGSAASGGGSALPPRDVAVAALTGVGLTEAQAGCVYDGISADPKTAASVAALLGIPAAGADSSPGPTTTVSPAAAAATNPDITNQLVLAVAPCLDQATLVGLLAAGQGIGAANNPDAAAISSLLKSVQGLDLSKLVGFDPQALAKAAAGALGPQQQAQLQALLAAVGTSQNALASNPLLNLDIKHLDLSHLSQEQMPLLLLALLEGLTADQQGQLATLTKVKLDELHLNIDPDELTPDEIGSLLLILAPLLAGAIRTDPAQPGPGGPGQVYLPPGLDLSNMNPLIFLNRNDVIAQFAKQGMDVKVGACLFDDMARMSPETIAAFFSKDAGSAAAAAILLATISCIVQNR